MRIGVISLLAASAWGGCEELWASLAAAALRAGHEVGIFAYRWPETPQAVQDLQLCGAEVFFRRLMNAGRFERLVTRFVPAFKDLERFRPDVVCISQPSTHDGAQRSDMLQALEILRRLNVPYVVLCHAQCEYQFPFQAQRLASREILTGAAAVGFVAQRNVQIAERHLACSLPRAVVLRNPLSFSDQSIVNWPEAEAPRMAVVSRLDVAIKGLDTLLELLAQSTWQGRVWHLSIYGDGPDRQALEELTEYYDLRAKVEFHGHARDIRGIWAAEQMLLQPSRTESAPISMVEAMICGRAAVATDVGGVREWVDDGQSGFIAAAATLDAYGAALERAWHARHSWREFGQRAHDSASGRIDPAPGETLLDTLTQTVRKTPSAASQIRPMPHRA